MFYNHEILTSRKHGVAIVWLVATLGSRSYTRKVSKKDILGVNVPKACDVIISPDAPMALRLQSNLLAGVCRVYSQQCTYVLADAQNVQLDIRRLLRTTRDDRNIDPEAGRIARPEQLLQPDDPTFLPGLDDLPSLELDLTEPSSQSESVLSPRSKASSRSSFGPVPEIQIPSSTAGSREGINLGAMFSESLSGVGDSAHKRSREVFHIDDDALLPEPDFAFDHDGNLYDIDVHQTVATEPLMTPLRRPSRAASVAPLHSPSQGSIGLHHQETEPLNFDYDIPRDDDFPSGLHGDADAFLAQPRSDEQAEPHSSSPQVAHSSHHSSQPPSTPSLVVAPQRRKRVAKGIALDKRTELRNSELLAWQHDYLPRMAKLNEKRLTAKALSLSKKNADWFTFAGGIGGIGFEVRRMGLDHPLASLCGQSLYDMLTGADVRTDGVKRDHASVEEGEEHDEPRRVRPRSEEYGRGADDAPMFDDTAFDPGLGLGDEDDRDIEVGRTAPSPLRESAGADDVSGTMPWNMASGHKSSHHTLSSVQPARLSQQLARLESQRAGSRSRLTSASPLRGRGRIASRQASLLRDIPQGAESSSAGDGGMDLPVGEAESVPMGPNTQFQMFGPAAAVETQIANQSQFIRTALDKESTNFLSFLEHTVDERGIDIDISSVLRGPNDANVDRDTDRQKAVTFENLLPAETNNHIVAAQGLLHALTLATRGLAWLRQEGWTESEDADGAEWIFDGDMWLGVNEDALVGEASGNERENETPLNHSDDEGRSSDAVHSGERKQRHSQQHPQANITDVEDGSEDELA